VVIRTIMSGLLVPGVTALVEPAYAAAANDNWANATAISTLPFVTSESDIISATVEGTDPDLLLLWYAILKVQLFDIDLRIKHGIRRSTVAAVFLAAFLIVEQLVQNFFTGQFGILIGAVAAGLMLFALGHIRHFAAALANGAMPEVSATPEYVAFRKLEVYRAAFEGLYADAVVSDKERATLDRLRLKLGIQPRDALAIEEDVSRESAAGKVAEPAP